MNDIFLLLILTMLFACSSNKDQHPSNIQLLQPLPINTSGFDTLYNGKQVQLFTLKNKSGMLSEITNFGGRVVSLWAPDTQGNYEDIVLGYENLNGYLQSNETYFGALIGRYGNRIGKGEFQLNGQSYKLAINNGENHLHGGVNGFNNVVWDAKQITNQKLELTYISPDGEEGYPGNLNVKVIYELTDENELRIEYWATTDKATPINLTHHSFFNFHGAGKGSINDHILQINADKYTPVDKGLIPIGKLADVEGTPMDFRKPTAIMKRVNSDMEQMKFGMGYDHNWALKKQDKGLTFAAKITEPSSGRMMEVWTNEPGLQFYGGNFLDGRDKGKNGKVYEHRTAFCLETQHFPDSPNKKDFPSTILNPGEEYYSICIYKFMVVS